MSGIPTSSNMVYNELTDVYHFSQSQIYNGGYVIRTCIDDAKMAALYQDVRDNEAQIDQSSHPVRSHLHARGRGARGPRHRRHPGPVPRARLPGVEVQRDGQGHQQELLQEDRLRSEHGGVQPRAGRLLVQAVHPVDRRQRGHERADQHARRLQQPVHPAGHPSRRCTRPASVPAGESGWYLVHNDSAAENGPYTPQTAMAVSINTAYANLWHVVAGPAVRTSSRWRRTSA